MDNSVYMKPNITLSQEDLVNQMNSLNGELDAYRNTTITHQLGETTGVGGDTILLLLDGGRDGQIVKLSRHW